MNSKQDRWLQAVPLGDSMGKGWKETVLQHPENEKHSVQLQDLGAHSQVFILGAKEVNKIILTLSQESCYFVE